MFVVLQVLQFPAFTSYGSAKAIEWLQAGVVAAHLTTIAENSEAQILLCTEALMSQAGVSSSVRGIFIVFLVSGTKWRINIELRYRRVVSSPPRQEGRKPNSSRRSRFGQAG